jgi:hypothetical protein
MALLDNLVSYWRLEESSGTRGDAHGGNSLTDNNSVGSAAGKLGSAAAFSSASNQYLSHADNADLSTGDIDFTFAAWVYLTDKSDTRAVLGKYSGTQDEYTLYYFATDDRFVFEVNGTTFVEANSLGAPALNTWYHVVCWHDSVNNQLGIAVNAGSADTTAFSAGVNDSDGEFAVGRMSGALGHYWDGRIDALGFWKRVLTAQERSDLYNAGNGLEHPFSSGNRRLTLQGLGADRRHGHAGPDPDGPRLRRRQRGIRDGHSLRHRHRPGHHHRRGRQRHRRRRRQRGHRPHSLQVVAMLLLLVPGVGMGGGAAPIAARPVWLTYENDRAVPLSYEDTLPLALTYEDNLPITLTDQSHAR